MIDDISPLGEGFSDKVYNVLKWVTLIFLPALATFYFALSGIWDFPNPEEVMGTIVALTTFLGVLLGVSQMNYKSSGAAYDGDVVVERGAEGGVVVGLELNKEPEDLGGKDALVFKVTDPNDPFWQVPG